MRFPRLKVHVPIHLLPIHLAFPALALTFSGGLLAASCDATRAVPDRPTWADVEPILRGSCTHCHGATAAVTGSSMGVAYRFDFYDMTAATCGEAAQAISGMSLAHSLATLIQSDITSPGSGWRPRMPPAPAGTLLDWERETVMRWASQPDPPKGEPQRDNRRPDIQIEAPAAMADKRLALTAVVSDPDGEAVAGVVQIGELSLPTDHAGAFSANVDTSAWAAGVYPLRAVLCDGWDAVTYDLGNVQIAHPSAPTK